MTTNEEARAEAHRRYDGDRLINELTGEYEPHDDYGYADTARQAFIAGALWAAPDHQAEAPSGPAHVGLMPPIPETARRLYTMYCRDCGTEEGMAEEADSPMLAEKRDAHNRWHAARPVVDEAAVPEGEA